MFSLFVGCFCLSYSHLFITVIHKSTSSFLCLNTVWNSKNNRWKSLVKITCFFHFRMGMENYSVFPTIFWKELSDLINRIWREKSTFCEPRSMLREEGFELLYNEALFGKIRRFFPLWFPRVINTLCTTLDRCRRNRIKKTGRTL